MFEVRARVKSFAKLGTSSFVRLALTVSPGLALLVQQLAKHMNSARHHYVSHHHGLKVGGIPGVEAARVVYVAKDSRPARVR